MLSRECFLVLFQIEGCLKFLANARINEQENLTSTAEHFL